MEITSSAFGSGEMIPAKYTCDGPIFRLRWIGREAPQALRALPRL